jgi:hypothetical protein
MSNEIKAVIVSQKRIDGYSAEFYCTSKEEIRPMLLKIFHKIERKEHCQKSFYDATITLILKLDKDITKKKKIIGLFP